MNVLASCLDPRLLAARDRELRRCGGFGKKEDQSHLSAL